MLVLSLRKAVKAAAVCPPVTGAATAQGLTASPGTLPCWKAWKVKMN